MDEIVTGNLTSLPLTNVLFIYFCFCFCLGICFMFLGGCFWFCVGGGGVGFFCFVFCLGFLFVCFVCLFLL